MDASLHGVFRDVELVLVLVPAEDLMFGGGLLDSWCAADLVLRGREIRFDWHNRFLNDRLMVAHRDDERLDVSAVCRHLELTKPFVIVALARKYLYLYACGQIRVMRVGCRHVCCVEATLLSSQLEELSRL
jgi:hypothetical protein